MDKRQAWPPRIVKGDNWESLYADAKGHIDVLPTCDEAIAWANDLVASIDKT